MASKREILKLVKAYMEANQDLNRQTYHHGVNPSTLETARQAHDALWTLIESELLDGQPESVQESNRGNIPSSI